MTPYKVEHKLSQIQSCKMKLSESGCFVHLYAKYFYIVLCQCLKYWCFLELYTPYWNTGKTECDCQKEYPTIEIAMNGWGSHVMTNCMENEVFRAKIIEEHKARMGYYAKDFFEKNDPFNKIMCNSNLEHLVIYEMKLMYKWNVCHVNK